MNRTRYLGPHSPRHLAPRSRAARRVIALLLAAAMALVGGAVLAASRPPVATAAASGSVVPGAGRWIAGHTDFVGSYRARVRGRWVIVYCVSPDLRTPDRITLATSARLAATTVVATRAAAQTLSAHGRTTSAGQAEAVSQAVNYELGNRAAVARRAHYLSPVVQTLARRYVVEARRAGGPYELALHLGSAPLPGQSGRGVLSLRGPGGGRAATVRLSATAAVSVPRTVRLDAVGHGSFRYRAIGAGPARIDAAVDGLPAAAVLTSRPLRGQQRMITWSPTVSARASAHYQARMGGFSDTYDCSSTCNGRPRVSLTACAAPDAYPSTITFAYGRRTHEVAFPAATGRQCATWVVRLPDATRVTATWRFRTPSGWTAPQPTAGALTVDCPPVPPVAVSVGLDCHQAALTAVLGRRAAGGGGGLIPLRNGTSHVMVLDVGGTGSPGGQLSAHAVLLPGRTATPQSVTVACDAAAEVTVRAGIRRADGTVNYGHPLRVVLP